MNKFIKPFQNFCKGNRSLLLFLIIMFMFRSSFADWNTVPTGSMKPTIVEGDRIFVNKMAYDVRLPFSHVSLWKLADPERGDIIVFDSNHSNNRLVKRVIGVPGDSVSLADNRLFINGQALDYNDLHGYESTIDRTEDLLGVKHSIRVQRKSSQYSSFPTVVVPDDHYLVLGDNRDNSADSRLIGFVPRREIVGKTNHVIISLNYNNYYLPRTDRFFNSL